MVTERTLYEAVIQKMSDPRWIAEAMAAAGLPAPVRFVCQEFVVTSASEIVSREIA